MEMTLFEMFLELIGTLAIALVPTVASLWLATKAFSREEVADALVWAAGGVTGGVRWLATRLADGLRAFGRACARALLAFLGYERDADEVSADALAFRQIARDVDFICGRLRTLDNRLTALEAAREPVAQSGGYAFVSTDDDE